MLYHLTRKSQAAFATVLLFCAFFSAAASAATVQMVTNIGFDSTSGLSKSADLQFGKIRPEPNDNIIMNTDGKVTLIGTGTVEDPYGTPGKIVITDVLDQEVSVMPMNYSTDHGLSNMTALCSNGSGSDTDCRNIPSFTGAQEKVLNIGMDLRVNEDLSPGQTDSSFDMSVVYQ